MRIFEIKPVFQNIMCYLIIVVHKSEGDHMRKSKRIYLEARPVINHFLELEAIDKVITEEEKERKEKVNKPSVFVEKVLYNFKKKRL